MQLNRYILNRDLPAILKQPLVFGNREQIEALQDLEVRIEKLELRGKLPLKKFKVTFTYSDTYVEVDAINNIEAEELAEEKVSWNDVEVDSVCAFEI